MKHYLGKVHSKFQGFLAVRLKIVLNYYPLCMINATSSYLKPLTKADIGMLIPNGWLYRGYLCSWPAQNE